MKDNTGTKHQTATKNHDFLFSQIKNRGKKHKPLVGKINYKKNMK